MAKLQQSPKAVYIHIPFCTNKCYYCDFNSFVLNGQPVDAYLTALEQEMERTVRLLPPERIDTVFVGGGTPTVLTPPQMTRFLASVQRQFPVSKTAEFTMEANPGTTEADKLAAMREGGVNRISFGVQSFDNGLLERIGRIHSVDDVYRSLELARAAGFSNLSIDLMFGLPGQTPELLEGSVERALALDLPHYSLYGLKVEENTLFHTLYERNELPLPSEEDELAMYLLIMERLKAAGRRQYEISNFARPGFESRHNITYWRNEPYYGLGAGAHGYAQGLRHVNIKGVQPFIDAAGSTLPRMSEERIPEQEAMEDFMMVGLRVLDGVRNADFAAQFPGRSIDSVFGAVLRPLLDTGLLARIEDTDGYGYRLTEQGVPLGNEVFGAFIAVAEK
ncbi:coproporphyrinogen III oxidase [Paenibacillus darwinianus]|uniref:Heme chaperone HemW n=1 Tax=Paenibacillus darwinianus TaxID=1380763 RepID=A0A9W5S085_9BACL|nr:radical SAM family heme chaperone HemW [Paenibacillus darwinianus]EXX87961.1 coproporphyrinogen III oxidase [Paenibacillus darwinianus]EXX88051.1 coproporphyrinogen III oxidase [Paenibacillus darwinianus]EXX89189.1 coproporphyrinogen III oxidase [Paenibacillus darwinianus]